jgi:hypothetical protein
MGNPLFAILEQRIVKVLSYGIHGQPSAAWLPDKLMPLLHTMQCRVDVMLLP